MNTERSEPLSLEAIIENTSNVKFTVTNQQSSPVTTYKAQSFIETASRLEFEMGKDFNKNM
jgi:hypothetical protein